METITVDYLWAISACYWQDGGDAEKDAYVEARLPATPLEVAAFDLPPQDLSWLFLRKDFFAPDELPPIATTATTTTQNNEHTNNNLPKETVIQTSSSSSHFIIKLLKSNNKCVLLKLPLVFQLSFFRILVRLLCSENDDEYDVECLFDWTVNDNNDDYEKKEKQQEDYSTFCSRKTIT